MVSPVFTFDDGKTSLMVTETDDGGMEVSVCGYAYYEPGSSIRLDSVHTERLIKALCPRQR